MIDLEPPIPRAEELEACAKAQREGVALWIWNDDYFENVLLWMEIWANEKNGRRPLTHSQSSDDLFEASRNSQTLPDRVQDARLNTPSPAR
jgi:hypothetical protein